MAAKCGGVETRVCRDEGDWMSDETNPTARKKCRSKSALLAWRRWADRQLQKSGLGLDDGTMADSEMRDYLTLLLQRIRGEK